MLVKVQNIYDYSLFENHTDKQLADIYKVSLQRIAFLRNRHASHTNSHDIVFNQNTKRIDDLILCYIKNNPTSILIDDFRKINLISKKASPNVTSKRLQCINKKRFQKIANENDIKITFKHIQYNSNEHGNHCGHNKCKCDIYKLAKAIRVKTSKSKKYNRLPIKLIDYFANKYVNVYRELNPFRKTGCSKILSNFYSEIFKEIDEILNYQDLDSGLLANKNSESKLHTEYIFAKSNMNKDVTDFNLPLMF